jgi:hypothetical protein
MKEGARYVKIVEWSEEDQCLVGSCPGLFYGGCHGDDESQVFAELCEIVDDTIDLYSKALAFSDFRQGLRSCILMKL